MPRLRVAALAALLVLPAARAAAFQEDVHAQVALQAARLMPSSLRSVLASNIEELERGARAPLRVTEDGLFLLPDGAYGTLDQTVMRQAQRVVDLLKQRAPMATVAHEFGVLSQAVGLASDPLHVMTHDPRTADWAEPYQRFVETRRPRFRVAFGGYAAAELDRDDVPGFVRAAAERTRRSAPLLPGLFILEDGTVARIASFDDRHPVFGVASIGYSHAITDTARLWLYIWIKAGGDASGLPFPQALPPGTVAGAASAR